MTYDDLQEMNKKQRKINPKLNLKSLITTIALNIV